MAYIILDFLNTRAQIHPGKEDPEAPLWTVIKYIKKKDKNEPLKIEYPAMHWQTLDSLLKLAAKHAGIAKRVNPHFFRHSRLTATAKFLPDAKLRVFAGWTPDSRMSGTYIHLSGADLDADFEKQAGMEPETKPEKSVLAPKTCTRCQAASPGTAEYCIRCGLPFDPTQIVDMNVESLQTQVKKLNAEMQHMMGLIAGKTIVQELPDGTVVKTSISPKANSAVRIVERPKKP